MALIASTVLTDTVPARSADETRWARDRLRVHTEAASPYTVSLAIEMASASSLNVCTASTGPNTSSVTTSAMAGDP